MKEKVFVYGTLLPTYGHTLMTENTHLYRIIGNGEIRGKMLDVGHYPAIVKGDGTIKGTVIEIYDTDFFKKLDKYEGCYPDCREKSDYIREKITVRTDNSNIDNVWVYWYILSVENLKEIPSGDYMEHLKEKINS